MYKTTSVTQWRLQDFGSGDHFKEVGLLVGPDAWQLSKICEKMSSENCKKIYYFIIFFKILENHAFHFRSFERKTQMFGNFWEIFERFWQIFQSFWQFFQIMSLENRKKYYFIIFFKDFTNPAFNFRAFGLKTQKVVKILRKFWKFSKKSQKKGFSY